MPWARFDDRFPSNRKVRLLSDAAFRLYVSAICWSAENLTDGVVKKTELRLVSDVKAASRRAQELVEAGLFEALEGGGWKVHDYHEYNPTAEQVKADRAAKTARQQRWRQKQQGDTPDPQPPGNRPDVDASTDASRDGAGDAAPRARVPDPTRPVPTDGADAGGESAGSGPRAAEPDGPTPIEIDGFHLTDAMRRWALQTFGPAIDVDHSTQQFVSHYRSTGARRKSWPDAWQKWIRDDAQRATHTGRPALRALPGAGPITREDAALAKRNAARDYLDELAAELRATGGPQ
jgi:hypothetical protein